MIDQWASILYKVIRCMPWFGICVKWSKNSCFTSWMVWMWLMYAVFLWCDWFWDENEKMKREKNVRKGVRREKKKEKK